MGVGVPCEECGAQAGVSCSEFCAWFGEFAVQHLFLDDVDYAYRGFW